MAPACMGGDARKKKAKSYSERNRSLRAPVSACAKTPRCHICIHITLHVLNSVRDLHNTDFTIPRNIVLPPFLRYCSLEPEFLYVTGTPVPSRVDTSYSYKKRLRAISKTEKPDATWWDRNLRARRQLKNERSTVCITQRREGRAQH